jgi:hypothetical protein
MALSIGNAAATTGMTGAVYKQLRAALEPDLPDDMDPVDVEKVRAGWRKLAHAVATGVIQHLLSNMEVRDVQTRGNISPSITGSTETASGHTHPAGGLSASQSNVTFPQVAGTGTVA